MRQHMGIHIEVMSLGSDQISGSIEGSWLFVDEDFDLIPGFSWPFTAVPEDPPDDE